MSAKERGMCKKYLFPTLRICSGIGCVLAFLVLGSYTVQQYRSGLTVLTPKIVPYEDGKEFPAITFCNETGFKAVEDYSDLDTYLNDTMDFQDMFLSPIKLAMGFGNKTVLDYENFLEILTAYRGRCYTYKSAYKFKSGEWLQFSLKSNVGLKILIHEPGVELLHHFSYYIGHSITTVDVRLSDSYVDITLEKTVSEKRDQGYCRHWGTEEYIGCSRDYARKKNMEDPKFQNCTEPVIQSFMGIPRMNMTNSNPCSLKDMAYNSESTIARFFEGESRECQVPCSRSTYKASIGRFDKFGGSRRLELVDPGRTLYFFYRDNNVVHMEDSLLMTTSDFFNAIGGSLGLFLGFSAISVLDKIIDFMKKFAK